MNDLEKLANYYYHGTGLIFFERQLKLNGGLYTHKDFEGIGGHFFVGIFQSKSEWYARDRSLGFEDTPIVLKINGCLVRNRVRDIGDLVLDEVYPWEYELIKLVRP